MVSIGLRCTSTFNQDPEGRTYVKWLSVLEASETDEQGVVTKASISPDHLRLDEFLASRVADYLAEGCLVLRTTGRCEDVLDAERGSVVGLSLYTDGLYAWDEGLTYYVREYRLSPGDEFIAHCKSKDFLVGDVDDSAVLELISDVLGE